MPRHVSNKVCVWTRKGKKNKQRVETGPLQNLSMERKKRRRIIGEGRRLKVYNLLAWRHLEKGEKGRRIFWEFEKLY